MRRAHSGAIETPPRPAPGQWRLLAPALCAWAATAASIAYPSSSVVVVVISAIAGASLIAVWGSTYRLSSHRATALRKFIRTAASLVLVCCAALVLIGGRVIMLEDVRSAPHLVQAAQESQEVQVRGRLASYPQSLDGLFGERAWGRAEVHTPRGYVPVLLWLERDQLSRARWGPGTNVAISGRVTQLSAGDAAAFAIHVHNIQATAAGAASQIAAVSAQLRSALVHLAATVQGAELVPGFAVGDTQLVDERLHEDMLESSLSHLVAVSGSNTGLVVAAIVWLSSWFGAGVRLRLVIAAVGLAAFVVIVGPDASVQRAAVMAAVMIVSGFGGKRAIGLPALGMAIIVLLVLNPWQALQPGFALSVAATGGILIGTRPVASWLHVKLRLAKPIALAVAVASIAQFTCAPLLLLLQEGVSAIGVLANVLAAPAAPIGTGFGLIATGLIPFSTPLAAAAVWVASLASRWVSFVAACTADLPFGRFEWPGGWGGALLLAGCQATLLLAWAIATGRMGMWGVGSVTRRTPWQTRLQAPRALRLSVAVMLGASCGVIAGVTTIAPHAERLAVPHDWIIVACDVGQGDALLIRDLREPDTVMLVDTGDDKARLQACLADFGVERIALLVLSHDDRDHVGALDAVIDMVDAALISPSPHPVADASRPVAEALQRAGVPFRVSVSGDGRSTPNGLRWHTLAPAAHATPANTNAASLVMLVETGETRVLLLGDIGEPEQSMLLRSGLNLSTDVLKVAHHGSRDQSQELIRAVGARWALVSVGTENRYGHPAKQTLTRLVEAHMQVLRTDQLGSIALVERPGGAVVAWAADPQRHERLG